MVDCRMSHVDVGKSRSWRAEADEADEYYKETECGIRDFKEVYLHVFS
jgi:hypothetical protein